MRFIAFEGLDGSGKSTLMTGLRSALEQRGLQFVQTREPGGTPLGDEMRRLILADGEGTPAARTEALLYQAGRAEHVEKLIKPTLARGAWVLSDRYAASSVAFQAGGREISGDQIEWLNRFSTAGLEPDLYVLLDLTVEESAGRLAGRPGEADRFEREQREFHQRVRDEYLKLARADADRWLILDASQSPPHLVDALLKFLGEKQWLV